MGPVSFLWMGIKNIPIIRVRWLFLILHYLLAVGSLFVPFHTVIFNIVFFLYFFIWGQIGFEDFHIGFSMFNPKRVIEIRKFLEEPGKRG